MAFDFPHAALPQLHALAASYAENTIEDELRRLLIELFAESVASRTFDANVLGMAHLGSLDLIRQAVNADGLSLISQDDNDAAMRYLYRTWKAADTQKRGLYFLQTLLQLLFPNDFEIYQIWHEFTIYFGDVGRYFDGSWSFKEEVEYLNQDFTDQRLVGTDAAVSNEYFLTSRINVDLGESFDPFNFEIQAIARIINACLPARLVLTFGCWQDIRYFATEDSVDCWYFGENAGAFGDKLYLMYDPWMNQ